MGRLGEFPSALLWNLGELDESRKRCRGRGLFLSLEFVVDKAEKSTFPVSLPLASMLDDAIFRRGVSIYSGFGKGTADGVRGDHILISPPLNITSSQVEDIIQAIAEGIDEVFSSEIVQSSLSGNPS